MKRYSLLAACLLAAVIASGCQKKSDTSEFVTETETDTSAVLTVQTEAETKFISEVMPETTETESNSETKTESVTETESETETAEELADAAEEMPVIESASETVQETTETAVPETAPVMPETISELAEAAETSPYDYYENSRHGTEPVYENWLFIGDSRTNGMADYNAMTYMAQDGCGLQYYYDNEEEILSYRNYNIVFNCGVNDLYNLNSYIAWYQNLPYDFLTENHVIVMSVNPTDKGEAYLTPTIENFNDNIAANLPPEITYADCYTYLTQSCGFETTDGTHYTGASYVDIYNFVKAF